MVNFFKKSIFLVVLTIDTHVVFGFHTACFCSVEAGRYRAFVEIVYDETNVYTKPLHGRSNPTHIDYNDCVDSFIGIGYCVQGPNKIERHCSCHQINQSTTDDLMRNDNSIYMLSSFKINEQTVDYVWLKKYNSLVGCNEDRQNYPYHCD
jgi:hypothetical protein